MGSPGRSRGDAEALDTSHASDEGFGQIFECCPSACPRRPEPTPGRGAPVFAIRALGPVHLGLQDDGPAGVVGGGLQDRAVHGGEGNLALFAEILQEKVRLPLAQIIHEGFVNNLGLHDKWTFPSSMG